MKELYIVRHGETDYNRANVVQGKGIDAPLNETGVAQAAQLFARYRPEGFDYLYTSTLRRTQQTVTKFIDHGLPWEALHELDEIGWGELEGMPAMHSRERIHALLERWRTGELHEKISGGESPLELYERHKLFIARYRATPYSKILICSHGRAIRILLSAMLGTPLEEMDQYHHRNTCVYKLIDDGTIVRLAFQNNLDHLHAAAL